MVCILVCILVGQVLSLALMLNERTCPTKIHTKIHTMVVHKLHNTILTSVSMRNLLVLLLSAQLCSMQLNLPLSELSSINIKHVRRLASPDDDSYSAYANVIYDLLLVKSNLADVPSSTDSLLTICVFLWFIIVLVVSCAFSVHCMIFINKINK